MSRSQTGKKKRNNERPDTNPLAPPARPTPASRVTSGIGRPCAPGCEPNDDQNVVVGATEEDTHLALRDEKQVGAAWSELWDKIWYYRCTVRESRGEYNEISQPGMRRCERQYGTQNLGPWSDFDWGYIQGKFAALNWVTGWEWDVLDT